LGRFLKNFIKVLMLFANILKDSETSQDKVYKDGQREHVINYISARITCTECCDNGEKENCKICGRIRMKDWWVKIINFTLILILGVRPMVMSRREILLNGF